jgi:hypothetical protein
MPKKLLSLSYFFFTIIFFLLWACASVPERKIQDNHFYSSIPKLSIDISKEFNHIDSGTLTTKYGNGKFNTEYYSFAASSDNKIINKGIIILIHKIPDYYFAIPLLDEKSYRLRDHSIKLFADQSYESAVINKPLFANIKPIEENLQQKGYSLPECKLYKILLKPLNRVLDYKNGIRTDPDNWVFDKDNGWIEEILYLEGATTSGFNCQQLNDLKNITPDQVRYIHKFIDRADKSIQFLPQ